MDDDSPLVVPPAPALSPVHSLRGDLHGLAESHLGSMVLQLSVLHLALYWSYTSLLTWSGSLMGQMLLPALREQQPPGEDRLFIKTTSVCEPFVTVPSCGLVSLIPDHGDVAEVVTKLLWTCSGGDLVIIEILLALWPRVTETVTGAGFAFFNLKWLEMLWSEIVYNSISQTATVTAHCTAQILYIHTYKHLILHLPCHEQGLQNKLLRIIRNILSFWY